MSDTVFTTDIVACDIHNVPATVSSVIDTTATLKNDDIYDDERIIGLRGEKGDVPLIPGLEYIIFREMRVCSLNNLDECERRPPYFIGGCDIGYLKKKMVAEYGGFLEIEENEQWVVLLGEAFILNGPSTVDEIKSAAKREGKWIITHSSVTCAAVFTLQLSSYRCFTGEFVTTDGYLVAEGSGTDLVATSYIGVDDPRVKSAVRASKRISPCRSFAGILHSFHHALKQVTNVALWRHLDSTERLTGRSFEKTMEKFLFVAAELKKKKELFAVLKHTNLYSRLREAISILKAVAAWETPGSRAYKFADRLFEVLTVLVESPAAKIEAQYFSMQEYVDAKRAYLKMKKRKAKGKARTVRGAANV